MKMRKSELAFFLRISAVVLGLTLLIFGGTKLFAPELKDYPPLDSCFHTSVFKIQLCSKNPNYVLLGHISEDLVRAIVMSEDDKFFNHHGVDWVELKNSLNKNLTEKRFARGGSTITQQLVKNAYLYHEKSLVRKLKEFLLARAIEKKYPKSIILEKYLNLIEFGKDIYGVKRASQFYFKKSVSDLNLLESMYLVTLIPNPKRLSKSFFDKKLTDGQIKKMKSLLNNFRRRGFIDDGQKAKYEAYLVAFPWEPGFEENFNLPSNSQIPSDSLEAESEQSTSETNSEDDEILTDDKDRLSNPSQSESYETPSNLNPRFENKNNSGSEEFRDNIEAMDSYDEEDPTIVEPYEGGEDPNEEGF